jgi:hypothetical protein
MKVVAFDAEQLDKWWNANPFYRRRLRVEKRLRKELIDLAARYGLELNANLSFSTKFQGRGEAWKARKEEDVEIAEMNRLQMRAYLQAEQKARE